MWKSSSTDWKLILAMLLATSPGRAADIVLTVKGPYLTVGTGLNWNSTGANGTDNNYLFTPSTPDTGVCLFIVNNDTSAHGVTPLVFQSGDPRVNTYTGQSGRYVAVNVQGYPTGGTPINVAANTALGFFAKINAAARVSVNLTTTGAGGTADIYITETTSGSCGGVQSGAFAVQGAQTTSSNFAANPLIIGGVESANFPNGAVQPMQISNTGKIVLDPSSGPLLMAGFTSTSSLVPLLIDATGDIYTRPAVPTCLAPHVLLSPLEPQFPIGDTIQVAYALFTNIAATGTVNLTIKNGDGSATYIDALAIANGGVYSLAPQGSLLLNGMEWGASAANGIQATFCYFP